jgi:hypothetical protein
VIKAQFVEVQAQLLAAADSAAGDDVLDWWSAHAEMHSRLICGSTYNVTLKKYMITDV